LRREEGLSPSRVDFLRGGLVVPKAGERVAGSVRGMVLVEDDALIALLGDAENPAHTEWHWRADKVKANYTHGPSTVRFVIKSASFLVSELSRAPEGIDEDALIQVFYLEEPEKKPPEKPGDKESRKPDPAPDSQPQPFSIDKREGGFKVSIAADWDKPVGLGGARVAYDVRRGNPFKRYDPLDFSLEGSALTIAIAGGTITRLAENNVEFSVDSDDFELVIKGFDPNRDLIVEAFTLGGEEGES